MSHPKDSVGTCGSGPLIYIKQSRDRSDCHGAWQQQIPTARTQGRVDDGGRRADVAKRRFVSIYREAMLLVLTTDKKRDVGCAQDWLRRKALQRPVAGRCA
jgi:hypothetical protein